MVAIHNLSQRREFRFAGEITIDAFETKYDVVKMDSN